MDPIPEGMGFIAPPHPLAFINQLEVGPSLFLYWAAMT